MVSVSVDVQRVSSRAVLVANRTHKAPGVQVLRFNMASQSLPHCRLKLTVGTLESAISTLHNQLVDQGIKI